MSRSLAIRDSPAVPRAAFPAATTRARCQPWSPGGPERPPRRIRRRSRLDRFCGGGRYPPIWFAVPLGLFMVGVREQWLPFLGLRECGVEPHLSHSFPIAWIATVLALGAVLIRYSKCQQRAEPTNSSEGPPLDNVSPDSVQQWIVANERPLENHEPGCPTSKAGNTNSTRCASVRPGRRCDFRRPRRPLATRPG